MTIKEVSDLIQEKYGFTNELKEIEVKNILSDINEFTTEDEFKSIVNRHVSNTEVYANEAEDMSDTISILKQIKASLKK